MTRFALLLLLIFGTAFAAGESSVEAAMKLVAAGKLEEAEVMLRALAGSESRNTDVHYRLGLVLLKRGKPEEALHELEAASKLDPKFPFGGFKHSGLGRELGPEGIDPYTELQSVILPAG